MGSFGTDECLNEHCFRNLVETREKIEAWRQDYNRRRPHGAPGYPTPKEFTAQIAARRASPLTPVTFPPTGPTIPPGTRIMIRAKIRGRSYHTALAALASGTVDSEWMQWNDYRSWQGGVNS